jgi:hypothetical protein
VAEKAFDVGAGFGTRSLQQPSDGFVYFQQVALAENAGVISQPNNIPAVSVYRFAQNKLETVLNSTADTPVGLSDVSLLAEFTRNQLSNGVAIDDQMIAAVQGYLPMDVLNSGSTGAIVNSAVFDLSEEEEGARYLMRFNDDGSKAWGYQFNPEVKEIKVVRDATGFELFFNSFDTNFGYHLDTTSGALTRINNTLFDRIDGNSVPTGFGSSTDDTINGTNSADFLYGFGGKDSLSGGDGNDWLFGGTGNDTLIGGAGDDMFFGGLGADRIELGTGKNTVVFASSADSPETAMDTVVDFGADDKIDLTRLLSSYSDFSIKQFTNEPQLIEISNVRLNQAKTRISADIIVSKDSSLFNTSEKISESLIYFEFDSTTATLQFLDSSVIDEEIVPNTDIRIIQQGVDEISVPMLFSGTNEKPTISDIPAGTKLLQVNFIPKVGFTVDDIQISMTKALISAELVGGQVLEMSTRLPNSVNLKGEITEDFSVVAGMLAVGIDSSLLTVAGDNEMRISHDKSADGLLKIVFDSNSSVGESSYTTLWVNGITTPITLENFVLPIV